MGKNVAMWNISPYNRKERNVAYNDEEEGSKRREELHCRREVLRGTCSTLFSDMGG